MSSENMMASSGKALLLQFTEYPGKPDFLQFDDIRLSRGCLQEAGQNHYNLPVTFRRASCDLSCSEK
jgi:hypothetical protein